MQPPKTKLLHVLVAMATFNTYCFLGFDINASHSQKQFILQHRDLDNSLNHKAVTQVWQQIKSPRSKKLLPSTPCPAPSTTGLANSSQHKSQSRCSLLLSVFTEASSSSSLLNILAKKLWQVSTFFRSCSANLPASAMSQSSCLINRPASRFLQHESKIFHFLFFQLITLVTWRKSDFLSINSALTWWVFWFLWKNTLCLVLVVGRPPSVSSRCSEQQSPDLTSNFSIPYLSYCNTSFLKKKVVLTNTMLLFYN